MNFRCNFEQGQQIASRVWNSKAFFPAVFVVALFMLLFELQLAGMFLFAAVTVLLLIFCDDLL